MLVESADNPCTLMELIPDMIITALLETLMLKELGTFFHNVLRFPLKKINTRSVTLVVFGFDGGGMMGMMGAGHGGPHIGMILFRGTRAVAPPHVGMWKPT